MADVDPNHVNFDLYSPFFRAVIISNDGLRFPLWTREQVSYLDTISDGISRVSNPTQGFSGIRLPDQFAFRAEGVAADSSDYVPHSLAYVESITVDLNLGLVPSITLSMRMPLDEARRLLNSRVIEWSTSKLQVEFGYTTGGESVVLSPVYEGIILQPEVQYGTEASISITAQGTGGFELERSQSGRAYRGSRAQILEAVAEGHNRKRKRKLTMDLEEVKASGKEALTTEQAAALALTQNLVPAGQASLLNQRIDPRNLRSSVSYRRMFEELVEESQGYLTDWAFIWKLVREARCTMIVEGDTLRVFPWDSWLLNKAKRIYRFYNFPNPEWGPGIGDLTWPVFDISSDLGALYLPNAVKATVLSDVNSTTGESERTVLKDENIGFARVKEGDGGREPDDDAPGPDEDTGEGGGYFPGSPDKPSAVAQAESAMESMQTTMGVQLTLTTFMDPYISPGDVVEVRGMSARHDGRYAVLDVSFAMGSSGAQMTLSLISNAGSTGSLSQDMVAQFDPEESLAAAAAQDLGGGVPIHGPVGESVEVLDPQRDAVRAFFDYEENVDVSSTQNFLNIPAFDAQRR